jgi:hypothetical protein
MTAGPFSPEEGATFAGIRTVDQQASATSSTEPVTGSSSFEPGSVIETLFDELRTAKEDLQAAHWRNGFLEAQLQGKEEQLKLLPDYQHRAAEAESLRNKVSELENKLKEYQDSRWSRFWLWFTSKR